MRLLRHTSVALFLVYSMNITSIVGYGSHVIKNILPVLLHMENVIISTIHVRNPEKYKSDFNNFKFFPLSVRPSKNVKWVYIATPISTHYELSLKYIKMGFNIICEKPLTDNLEHTLSIYKYALKMGLQIHEVCMYKNHQQYEHLGTIVDKTRNELKFFEAKFQIPHLDKENIRYSSQLGGGALLDVGYYPISLFVSLFGIPKSISSITISESGYEVDTIGSALFEYDGISGVAHWGIGKFYQNYALLEYEKETLFFDRIFSKPSSYQTYMIKKSGILESKKDLGADNQFENQFQNIFTSQTSHTEYQVKNIIKVIETIKKDGNKKLL